MISPVSQEDYIAWRNNPITQQLFADDALRMLDYVLSLHPEIFDEEETHASNADGEVHERCAEAQDEDE